MTSIQSKLQKVILIEETSESFDVLQYADFPRPEISSPTDVIIKNKYSGINFIEAYFRKGIYPSKKPYVLGREAAGEIVEVGENVKDYTVGDKVAYISNGGTFAQFTKVDSSAAHILKLKNDASDELLKVYGSALILGLTALTFVDHAYKPEKGDNILVWAAAGSVGRYLVQLISSRGANVIAVASTDEKLNIAKKLGAKYLINSSKDNVSEKVAEFTKGKGVQCSFDSIGKDTFETSLEALAVKGTFVSFGNASGVVPPFSLQRLTQKNLKVLRPQLFPYLSDEGSWEKYSQKLLELIENKSIDIEITKEYPLSDYKIAAAELEGRKTTGKLVLKIPQ